MNKKSIKINFVMNAALQIATVIFPLIIFPYVSRILGPEGIGSVTYAMTIVSYFMLVAMLGIPTYGIRACAQVREDKDKFSKIVQEILLINVIVAGITLVVYLIALNTIAEMKSDKILYIICGSNLILNVLGMNWVYSALEEYRYITVRSIIFKLIGLILTFLLVHRKSDHLTYAGVTAFATAGSNIFNFINLRKYIRIKRYPRATYDLRRHIKPIFSFFGMGIAISIYSSIDILMLGNIQGDTAVGYYNAAVKVQSCLLMVVVSLGTVLLPRMSYYYKHDRSAFVNVERKAIYSIMWMAVPLMVFFMIFAPETIWLVAGSEYEAAIMPMRILMPIVLLTGLTNNLGNQILIPSNKEQKVMISTIVGAAVNIALNFLWISDFGVNGAAAATVMAVIAVLITESVFVGKEFRKMLIQLRYFKLLMALIVSMTGMIWVKSLELTEFWKITLGFGSSAMIYISVLFVLKEQVVREVTRQFLRRTREK